MHSKAPTIVFTGSGPTVVFTGSAGSVKAS